ncbi:MAG: hypothetical protein FRX49_13478 [Trebouxia sp. A1-2]|nr:MAG: hypothetical protein FRX49_13478 [Trebouxia sp. A1-2]
MAHKTGFHILLQLKQANAAANKHYTTAPDEVSQHPTTGGPYSALGGPSVSSSVTSMKKLVALSTGKRRLLLTSRLGKLTRIVSADRKAVWKAYDRAGLPCPAHTLLLCWYTTRKGAGSSLSHTPSRVGSAAARVTKSKRLNTMRRSILVISEGGRRVGLKSTPQNRGKAGSVSKAFATVRQSMLKGTNPKARRALPFFEGDFDHIVTKQGVQNLLVQTAGHTVPQNFEPTHLSERVERWKASFHVEGSSSASTYRKT